MTSSTTPDRFFVPPRTSSGGRPPISRTSAIVPGSRTSMRSPRPSPAASARRTSSMSAAGAPRSSRRCAGNSRRWHRLRSQIWSILPRSLSRRDVARSRSGADSRVSVGRPPDRTVGHRLLGRDRAPRRSHRAPGHARGDRRACAAILLSTPERVRTGGPPTFGPPPNEAHVREWSLDELCTLTVHHGFVLALPV